MAIAELVQTHPLDGIIRPFKESNLKRDVTVQLYIIEL